MLREASRTSPSAARLAATLVRTLSVAPRQYYTAVCAACGGEARVPFEPKSDRPVYCSDCFAKMREG